MIYTASLTVRRKRTIYETQNVLVTFTDADIRADSGLFADTPITDDILNDYATEQAKSSAASDEWELDSEDIEGLDPSDDLEIGSDED